MSRYLLADIGGTNARFAQADAGQLDPASIRRYRNDDHGSFADLLAVYLADRPAEVSAAVIAVAGQVAGDTGRLTNCPWEITRAEVARQTGGDRIDIVNDLHALGRALPLLGPGDLLALNATPPQAMAGQSLVVNIGTGFNLSFVISGAAGTSASMAEAGHASLGSSCAKALAERLGPKAAVFATVEDCFSGRGLSRLHRLRTGETLEGAALMASAEGDAEAFATVELFAKLLARLLHDLALTFLPVGGLFLVGSVAAGLARSRCDPAILASFDAASGAAVTLPPIPLALITSDEAALVGCLALAREGEQRERGTGNARV